VAFDNNIEYETSLRTVVDIARAECVERASGYYAEIYECFRSCNHHERRLPPLGAGVVPDASRFGREIPRLG
jgi:hypothetical protein